MTPAQAQEYVGRQVRGRLVADIQVSGGCTDKRLHLIDAEGERVVNVTNLTPAELDQQNRQTTAGNKGARHKTG